MFLRVSGAFSSLSNSVAHVGVSEYGVCMRPMTRACCGRCYLCLGSEQLLPEAWSEIGPGEIGLCSSGGGQLGVGALYCRCGE